MAWQFEEAGQRLEEIVEQSLSRGPQTVEQDGEALVVIVPIEQWRAAQMRTPTDSPAT